MKLMFYYNGATLLENLIAVCVFSTSILGILQLQSRAFGHLQQAAEINTAAFQASNCIHQARLLSIDKMDADCKQQMEFLGSVFFLQRCCHGKKVTSRVFVL